MRFSTVLPALAIVSSVFAAPTPHDDYNGPSDEGADAGSGTGLGAGLGLGLDVGLDVGAGLGAGAGAEAGAAVGADVDVGANVGAGLGAGVGAGVGAAVGAGVDAGANVGAGVDAAVDAAVGAGANAGAGVDVGANAGLTLSTGVSANMLIGANLMNFGAGFCVDSCQASMKAWLQAKGLCEADGSIGVKAKAYLQACLDGKAGFEGLFGLKAGLIVNGQGSVIAGLGASSGASLIFKGAVEGLLKSTGNFNADISVPQLQAAIKAWLQAKGQCEADGSIGLKAQAYLNAVLGGKAGFEGLLGVAAGLKLDGALDAKVGAGISVGTFKDACTGLVSGGAAINVGGQVAGQVGAGAGASLGLGLDIGATLNAGLKAGLNAGAQVGAGVSGAVSGLLGGLFGGKGSCACKPSNGY